MYSVFRIFGLIAILLVLAGQATRSSVAQTDSSGDPPQQQTTAGDEAGEIQTAQSTSDPQSNADSARDLIKRAVDHISKAENLSIEAEITYDVHLNNSLIALYTGDLTAHVSRPGKLFVEYSDSRETFKVWIDGEQVTYLDEITDHYSKVPGAETLEQTAGMLFQVYGLVLPLTKLLMADAYTEILNGGPLITYLGKGRLGEAEVHQVAVHGGDIDIQLWIDTGDTPVLHKIVTVNRKLPFAPRYAATFTKLETAEGLGDELFEPTLPDTAQETELSRFKQQDSTH